MNNHSVGHIAVYALAMLCALCAGGVIDFIAFRITKHLATRKTEREIIAAAVLEDLRRQSMIQAKNLKPLPPRSAAESEPQDDEHRSIDHSTRPTD